MSLKTVSNVLQDFNTTSQRNEKLHKQGVIFVPCCIVSGNHQGSTFSDHVSMLGPVKYTHTDKHTHINVGTMIWSKTMINHCIFAKQGQCYRGMIHAALHINRNIYNCRTSLGVVQSCIRPEQLYRKIHSFGIALSLPLTSVVKLNRLFVVVVVLIMLCIPLLLKVIVDLFPTGFITL